MNGQRVPAVEELAALPDAHFLAAWSDFQDAYLDAPTGIRAECIRRYRRLTGEVSHRRVDDGPRAAPKGERGDDRPRIRTARELHALKLRPLEQVVTGLLPEGATLLAGRPKVGKSWLALQTALAVSRGDPVLGAGTLQGDVLYLALEDSDRRMQARMRTQLLDVAADWPASFSYATEWPRFGDGGEHEILRWQDGHPNARLIVIDVLQKLMPVAGRGEGMYEADYRRVEYLKLIVRPGIAVLALTHLRKQGADDPLDLVTGTTGVTGGVDGALVLDRQRGGSEAVLHRISRDLEDTEPLGIAWDADAARWHVVGTAAEVQSSSERRRILAALREAREPLLPMEIADATGLSRPSVRHLVRKMQHDGLLVRVPGVSSQHRYEVAK